MFEPLQIAATLDGPLALPGGPLALDALLGATIAVRDEIPPAMSVDEMVDIEVPIQREPGGRFHLASFSEYETERREIVYINRRFPVEQAQAMAVPTLRQVRINAGPAKSYRLPLELIHPRGGLLTWWCVGDAVEIRELLACVGHLGKKRSVGRGRVVRWTVEPCIPWGPDFPVVREGQPLRNLPADWPGLADACARAVTRMTYPYWLQADLVDCAVPVPG